VTTISTTSEITTIDDLDAITATIRLYIEGSIEGDVDKLQQAFHPDARMFGQLGGARYDVPIATFFDLAAAEPTGGHRTKIVSIDQVGDGAAVMLAEEGYNGLDYIDFFSLVRMDGEWKIASKVFVHTGGEAPSVP
jgi:hypothetical protein